MAEEGLISPQRKAEHLLYMADAIQRSIKSRRNIVNDMNKERDAMVDDFEDSMQLDTSDMSLNTQDTPSLATTQDPPVTETRPKMPSKAKSEKKSKTKTIADRRQQLHDCKSALVEIKENASLKYLKLKMDYDELNESSMKLKELKAQADKENETLRRKLSSAVGADRVEWIAELESNQAKLQAELDQIKTERDTIKKEIEEVKKGCCASCLGKLKPTAQVAPAPRARSLWSLFQLDEEARATETGVTSTVATICGSGSSTAAGQFPPQKISFGATVDTDTVTSYEDKEYGEPSRASGSDDLEADLEAIEQKMKDEIENMSREWKRPSKKRVNNHTVRRDIARNNKRNNLAKTKSSARGTLDSFISQSIRNLGCEEMDEEKSFYSIQKSVLSSPDKDTEIEKRLDGERSVQSATASTSKTPGSADSSPDSQGSTTRVFGQDVDAVEVQDDDLRNVEDNPSSVSSVAAGDRRGLMSKAFSLRDSFRSLSEEVEDETNSSEAFERRLENLRTKSLRADFSMDHKKLPKSTLRSSTYVTDRKVVHWEDPSKKEDEANAKVRKEVEAWAAIDLAPITAFSS